jgi:hypothetical protein
VALAILGIAALWLWVVEGGGRITRRESDRPRGSETRPRAREQKPPDSG